MHIYRAKSGSFEALVTHGSIIRMLMDYVYLALNGTWKIYIGDAGLQDCDFEEYLKKSGIIKIELPIFPLKMNYSVAFFTATISPYPLS